MLTENKPEKRFNLAAWSKLAHSGSTNAIAGFSKMINQEITVKALNLEEVLARNVASLIGKTDDYVAGVYLSFDGNTAGHILLAFPPKTAFELVDMIMEQPSGQTETIGEMERSVLGEVGNIVGAFFLNTVADNLGQRLLPSPPLVFIDTVGAIINSVMPEVLMRGNPIFGIRLSFSTQGQEIEGRLLVLPTLD